MVISSALFLGLLELFGRLLQVLLDLLGVLLLGCLCELLCGLIEALCLCHVSDCSHRLRKKES